MEIKRWVVIVAGSLLLVAGCSLPWIDSDSPDETIRPPVAAPTATPRAFATSTATSTVLRIASAAVLELEAGTFDDLAWSPSGDLLVTIRTDDESDASTIQIWGRDGTLRHAIQRPVRVSAVVWAPDGEVFATSSRDGGVRYWDREGALLTTVETMDSIVASRLAWSPDGAVLAVGGMEKVEVEGTPDTTGGRPEFVGVVSLVNRDGQIVTALESGLVAPRIGLFLDWAGSEPLLVAGSIDFTVWRQDGAKVCMIPGDDPEWTQVVSQDGQLLVLGDESGGLEAYSLSCDLTVEEHPGWASIEDVAISLDCQVLAVAAQRVALIPVDAIGSVSQRIYLTTHASGDDHLAWSPSEDVLAWHSPSILSLWDTNGEMRATLDGCGVEPSALKWSPDGTMLAAGYDGGRVCLWEIPPLAE